MNFELTSLISSILLLKPPTLYLMGKLVLFNWLKICTRSIFVVLFFKINNGITFISFQWYWNCRITNQQTNSGEQWRRYEWCSQFAALHRLCHCCSAGVCVCMFCCCPSTHRIVGVRSKSKRLERKQLSCGRAVWSPFLLPSFHCLPPPLLSLFLLLLLCHFSFLYSFIRSCWPRPRFPLWQPLHCFCHSLHLCIVVPTWASAFISDFNFIDYLSNTPLMHKRHRTAHGRLCLGSPLRRNHINLPLPARHSIRDKRISNNDFSHAITELHTYAARETADLHTFNCGRLCVVATRVVGRVKSSFRV